jgi:hypothetical protein
MGGPDHHEDCTPIATRHQDPSATRLDSRFRGDHKRFERRPIHMTRHFALDAFNVRASESVLNAAMACYVLDHYARIQEVCEGL